MFVVRTFFTISERTICTFVCSCSHFFVRTFANEWKPYRQLSSLSLSPIANLLFCCDGVGHLGILVNKYTIARWNNIEKHLFGEGNKLTS